MRAYDIKSYTLQGVPPLQLRPTLVPLPASLIMRFAFVSPSATGDLLRALPLYSPIVDPTEASADLQKLRSPLPTHGPSIESTNNQLVAGCEAVGLSKPPEVNFALGTQKQS